MGVTGVRDFIKEDLSYNFRFKSTTKHAFTLRFNHLGFTLGVLNRSFKDFKFGFLTGFEYFYKLLSSTDGIFIYTDTGMSNNGPAFSFGLGLGNRMNNGFDINFTYLYNNALFSMVSFYFLIAKVFTINGKIGINLLHTNAILDYFTFFYFRISLIKMNKMSFQVNEIMFY